MNAQDFGYNGSAYATYFDRRSTHYFGGWSRKPAPVPAGEAQCRCPHCATEGWYDQSPRCKYWRSQCDVCDGQRYFRAANPHEREECMQCLDLWREAIRDFRAALTSK